VRPVQEHSALSDRKVLPEAELSGDGVGESGAASASIMGWFPGRMGDSATRRSLYRNSGREI
jgi:hypothetical protein